MTVTRHELPMLVSGRSIFFVYYLLIKLRPFVCSLRSVGRWIWGENSAWRVERQQLGPALGALLRRHE